MWEAENQREKLHYNAVATEASNGSGGSRPGMVLHSPISQGRGLGLFYCHSDQALDASTQGGGYSPLLETVPGEALSFKPQQLTQKLRDECLSPEEVWAADTYNNIIA